MLRIESGGMNNPYPCSIPPAPTPAAGWACDVAEYGPTPGPDSPYSVQMQGMYIAGADAGMHYPYPLPVVHFIPASTTLHADLLFPG